MRLKASKLVTIFVIVLNITALYYVWRLISHFRWGSKNIFFQDGIEPPVTTSKSATNRHVSKSITIVIRQFELFENDLFATVKSIVEIFPNVQIIIVCDDIVYPPLDFPLGNGTMKNVRVVNTGLNLAMAFKDRFPLFSIKTKYVLFVPDSTRIKSKQIIHSLMLESSKKPNDLFAVLYTKERSNACLKIDLNLREWTIKYSSVNSGMLCDAVSGKHAVLVETQLLKKLPDAFMLPFPEALYIQTAVQKSKVYIRDKSVMWDGKPVLQSHHSQARKQQNDISKRKAAYGRFSLKKVVRETGAVEWYGCTRDTPRCFGTVYNSLPSYLYKERWTPPCCLAHLRKTARHVLGCLAEAGVRHWLETESLLGAMRSGDILPWDFDVDVGINRDDINRSTWLSRASSRPVVDDHGFVWEKATEGQFFRVQYSKTNRIFVNIYPFYAKNGTMTSDGWFTQHKHMEFPDFYLHPMSSIEFLGKHVPSPNNIRDFLELKFGKGIIENPHYLDILSQKMNIRIP